jgi:hypothetical protein
VKHQLQCISFLVPKALDNSIFKNPKITLSQINCFKI